MSRYGSVSVTGASSLISRIVQSSLPDDLAALANAEIAALPAGYTVVAITLSGSGDGALFTVEIEAGANADVTDGITGASVYCFLGSTAQALIAARGAAAPASGEVADLQLAGASKGAATMGMIVKGTVVGAGGGVIAPFSRYLYVDSGTAVPVPDQTGSVSKPYSTIQAAVTAAGTTRYTIKVTGQAPYVGDFVIGVGAFLFIEGLAAITGNLTIGNTSTVYLVGSVSLTGNITAGDNVTLLVIDPSGIVGTVTAGNAFRGEFNGSVSGLLTCGENPNVTFRNGTPQGGFTSASATGGSLIIANAANTSVGSAGGTVFNSVGAISAANVGVGMSGCEQSGAATCYTFQATDCQVNGSITTNPVVSRSIVLKDCDVAAAALSGGSVLFEGTDFGAITTVTAALAAIFDSYSWRTFNNTAGVVSDKNLVTVRGVRRAQYHSASTDIDPGINIDLIADVEDQFCHLVPGTPSLIEFDKAGIYFVAGNVYSNSGAGALRAYLRYNPATIDVKFADAQIAAGLAACPSGTYTFAVGDRLAIFGESTALLATAGLTIQLLG